MRILKSNPLLNLGNSYLIDSPQPSNLSYSWNFGSLLAFCLVIQIITGVTLAMHYNPSVLEAFNSVEHIMRDVNNGWLIRYLHSNTASAFFFIVYLHIGRGMYYGSYRAPRTIVWAIGTIILVVMMATAFLGYVLPYGQMSLWGATVITNLMSAIPWIGQDIVEFIWGGFSVNNATLNRFFSLHFVLPFVLAALALMHLIALHDISGSGNPLGVSGNSDRIPFAPYYIFKDLITIFLLILILSLFVFFMPNVLGDSENYIMANPMQTPPAIVPEWYLLPFYAILRSIPNKLLGVIAMFSAILILLILPIVDISKFRGLQFKPISKMAFWIFLANFLILMQLGAKHVESPFIEFGQSSTILYFSYFLVIIPLITYFENTIVELNSKYYEPSYINNSTTTYINTKMSTIFPINLNLCFKHNASPQMEALVELHNNIMFYLFAILFSVGWILLSIIRNYFYTKSIISNKYLNHGTLIELIWTITPALILILIAFPLYELLYLMDETTDLKYYLHFADDDFTTPETVDTTPETDDTTTETDNTTNDTNNTTNDNDNPWDGSRIADCEHRDRNLAGVAQDEGDAPIPCDMGSHNATTHPGDIASFCNDCGAIICHNCDLNVSGEGPSPENTESESSDSEDKTSNVINNCNTQNEGSQSQVEGS